MKILTEEQLINLANDVPHLIAEYRPYWMAMYKPHWMAEYRPALMVEFRSDFMSKSYPEIYKQHIETPKDIMEILKK